jgi:hypothetical protein
MSRPPVGQGVRRNDTDRSDFVFLRKEVLYFKRITVKAVLVEHLELPTIEHIITVRILRFLKILPFYREVDLLERTNLRSQANPWLGGLYIQSPKADISTTRIVVLHALINSRWIAAFGCIDLESTIYWAPHERTTWITRARGPNNTYEGRNKE